MSSQQPPPEPGEDPPGSGLRWNPRSPGTPRSPGYHPDPTGEPPYGEPRFGHDQPYRRSAGPWSPPGTPGEWDRAPARTAPLAVTSVVLGILGLLLCTLVVAGPGAVVTGVLARRQVARSGGRLAGTGLATAGVVLGAVGTVLAVLFWTLLLTGALDASVSLDVT